MRIAEANGQKSSRTDIKNKKREREHAAKTD